MRTDDPMETRARPLNGRKVVKADPQIEAAVRMRMPAASGTFRATGSGSVGHFTLNKQESWLVAAGGDVLQSSVSEVQVL